METVVGYVLAEVNKIGKMSQTKEKLIPQAFKKKSLLYHLFTFCFLIYVLEFYPDFVSLFFFLFNVSSRYTCVCVYNVQILKEIPILP